MEPIEPISKPDTSELCIYFKPEPKNQNFYFDDKKLPYVVDHDGDIWFGAMEVMDILLFEKMCNFDLELTLEDDVLEENMAFFRHFRPKIIWGYDNQEIDKDTIFVNLLGIHLLVLDSRLDCNKYFLSWLDSMVENIKKISEKHEKQIFEERKKAFDLATVENADLKLQNQTNILMMDQQRNDLKISERLVQFLEIQNRAKDEVLNQQIIDTGVLQYEIQSLIREIQIKNDALKQYGHDNIPQRIRVMENEIQNKDDYLKQITVQDASRKTENDESVPSRTEELESVNHTNNEELKSMQIQMRLLENENTILKIQAQTKETQVLRRQDALLHLFRKNFVPKLYDKKLDEQFLVFRLNEDNFFTHYAVRSRIRNIKQQIKTIQARHPHAVELLRITFYPNEVNLFKLMRNHLKDKIQFKGNFFMVLNDEYTDEDLKNDVLKLFNESENMLQEVFQMMGIERKFKTNENVYESTGFEDENNPTNLISVNEINSCAACNPDQNQDSTSETSVEGGNTTSGLAQDSEIADVEGGNLKTVPDQEHDLKSALIV